MKKIFTVLVLAMASMMSWAAVNITVTPNEIDFGTLYLDENGEAEANATATLTWSGITDYCSVFMDTIGAPAANADYEFWATKSDGSDYWYTGDMYNPADNPTVYVGVYAIAPGEYTIRYNFYSFATEDDWYNESPKGGNAELVLKAKVVKKSTTGVENVQSDKVQCTKEIRNGQMYILRNGEKYSAAGTKVE